MGDLISRKALLDVMPKRKNLSSEIGRRTAAAIRRIIANAPSVDAEPVRHGKWIDADGMLPPGYRGKKYCSVCFEFALHDCFGREWLSWFCSAARRWMIRRRKHK